MVHSGKKPERYPKQLWVVRCVGNPQVEYEVLGTLKPEVCPACGGKAFVQIKGAAASSATG